MGETGCGKTRLIRFMCDLAAQGTDKGNMLMMKARKCVLHVPLYCSVQQGNVQQGTYMYSRVIYM